MTAAPHLGYLGYVAEVLAGTPRTLTARSSSSLGRVPVEALVVDVTAVRGDGCADLKHHGGPEKALHHYPMEHYQAWQACLNLTAMNAERMQPGGFGENLSTLGMTEHDVCIGDVIRMGSTILQVSQGRQPCWKLNTYFGHAHLASLAQDSGRLGWYYRVLAPGTITKGASIELLARPHPRCSLARVHAAIFQRLQDDATLDELSRLTHLSASWKALFAKRRVSGQVEDFAPRIHAPVA